MANLITYSIHRYAKVHTTCWGEWFRLIGTLREVTILVPIYFYKGFFNKLKNSTPFLDLLLTDLGGGDLIVD